jgi:hypothetical protein
MVTFLLLRTHGLKLEKQSGTSVPLTARLGHYIRKLLLPICSQQRVSVRRESRGEKEKGRERKERKRGEKEREKKGEERKGKREEKERGKEERNER